MLTFSVEKKSPWMAAERCGIKTRLIYMFCVLLWYICTVLCPDHVICMYCVLPWYNIGIVHCPGAYVLCLPWLWFVVVVPMYMYCVLPGYICIELCPVAYVLCVPWLWFFFFFPDLYVFCFALIMYLTRSSQTATCSATPLALCLHRCANQFVDDVFFWGWRYGVCDRLEDAESSGRDGRAWGGEGGGGGGGGQAARKCTYHSLSPFRRRMVRPSGGDTGFGITRLRVRILPPP